MATKAIIADSVARLYTSAGRSYGQVECQLFMEALRDIADDELVRATQVVVCREIWEGWRSPSPGMIRTEVRMMRTRANADRLALPPPRVEKTEARGRLAAIREANGFAPSTLNG